VATIVLTKKKIFNRFFSETIYMNTSEILIIAVGLAMDAFAVSVAAATSGKLVGKRATFRLSFHFGLFQGLMPVIGWVAGIKIAHLISAVDHWVAFGLLLIVGARMIISAFSLETESFSNDPSRGASLMILSVATSIDALAVGLSLAMLQISIWYPAVIIGIITALLSVIGIRAGRYFGEKLGPRMELIGGIILIGIGVKILLGDLMG
jgi:putative Mn2+ efflux pump MntP